MLGACHSRNPRDPCDASRRNCATLSRSSIRSATIRLIASTASYAFSRVCAGLITGTLLAYICGMTTKWQEMKRAQAAARAAKKAAKIERAKAKVAAGILTLEGTCGWCLGTFVVKGEKPIRHGFAAYDVRHGQHGGYHTGPCPGVAYAHHGESPLACQDAIASAERSLDEVAKALEHLASRPTLTWIRATRKEQLRIEVKPDAKADYSNGQPSYEHLLRERVGQCENQRDALGKRLEALRAALAGWTRREPTVRAPS